jgi:Flp pilus assembly pilin Flp
MLNFIKNFKNDESGAVTVDWVVLTAAIVLLGAAVGSSVSTGATDLSTAMGTDMTATAAKIPKPAG